MSRSHVARAAVLVALLVSSPALATPLATIPFHLNGTAIMLPVRIQNSDTLWFALDTGAAASSVNQPRAEQLGLDFRQRSVAQGAAGSVESRQLGPIDFQLGTVTLHTETASAFPLVGLAPRMGHVMDGIIGAELFQRYVVEIDYAHSTLRLYEPKDFHYGGKGERLPLTYKINLPYIEAAIRLSDGRRLEGRYVIDTGSSQAVILLPAYAARESVQATVTKTVAMSGQAVGGQTESRTGRLAGLDLGSLRLSQPLVSIAQTGPAHFAVEGAAGNIGGSILKKFRCTFDYARKEMILDPVSDLADPVPFDASGLVLITSGAAFDTITVSRVIPQSPAEEAGLQVGDQLLSVDGKPVTDLGVVRLRERLRQAGSSVTLAVSRGTRTWTVPLQLRQLL
ncbi:MAG TPA: aspartyl protease family protein [Candidatus Eisenbacteria bacterium]|nr:aspartyl protease family protein [Candidatus Eisenbacteria bacterium]